MARSAARAASLAREADEDRPRLIPRGVIVDDQLELRRLLADLRALERPERDGREEDLVPEAAAFEDHPVFELTPQMPAQRGDH